MSSIVGDTLRGMREARGWTLRHLATLAGIPHETLHTYEAGRCMPSLDRLLRLVEVFEASADERSALLNRQGAPPPLETPDQAATVPGLPRRPRVAALRALTRRARGGA